MLQDTLCATIFIEITVLSNQAKVVQNRFLWIKSVYSENSTFSKKNLQISCKISRNFMCAGCAHPDLRVKSYKKIKDCFWKGTALRKHWLYQIFDFHVISSIISCFYPDWRVKLWGILQENQRLFLKMYYSNETLTLQVLPIQTVLLNDFWLKNHIRKVFHQKMN